MLASRSGGSRQGMPAPDKTGPEHPSILLKVLARALPGHANAHGRPTRPSALACSTRQPSSTTTPISGSPQRPDLVPPAESATVEVQQQPMMEFLHGLGLQAADIDVMLTRCPRLLSFSTQRQAAPVVEFLAGLGFDHQQVAATIRRFPHLLAYSLKGHLVPHTHYLKSLGVSEEELPQLILARPHVLGTSIELVITYLRRLRIQRTNVGKLLWSYPLDYSLPRLVLPHTVAFPDWDEVDSSLDEPQAPPAAAAGGAGVASTADAAQQQQQPKQPSQQHPLGSAERCSWLVLPSQQQDGGGDKPAGPSGGA